RALEVNAENARFFAGGGAGCIQSQPHLLRAVAYERGQQTGCSKFSMRGGDAANALHGWLIVEQHVSAAVPLQVEESRSKPCSFRQPASGHGARQLAGRDEIHDASAVHDDGGTLAHDRAVENVVRGDGVQYRAIHLVRVIFCKWRGRSTLKPRHWATRMARPWQLWMRHTASVSG